MFAIGGVGLRCVPKEVAVPNGCYTCDQFMHPREPDSIGEFCLSPSIVEYTSITFLLDDIIIALWEPLDQLGYTTRLHKALRNLQEAMAQTSEPHATQVAVANRLATPDRGMDSASSEGNMRPAGSQEAPTV